MVRHGEKNNTDLSSAAFESYDRLCDRCCVSKVTTVYPVLIETCWVALSFLWRENVRGVL